MHKWKKKLHWACSRKKNAEFVAATARYSVEGTTESYILGCTMVYGASSIL